MALVGLGFMVLSVLATHVQAQNIDMNNCMTSGVVHTFEMTEGELFPGATISVVNATATVFWQFDFPSPGGADNDVVTSNGVTVTIPVTAGDAEGTPVANTETVDITSAGAHTEGEFNFQITVANNDGSSTCQQEYQIKIFSVPLDIALLLDHSGSMNTTISGSTTRWTALRDAIGNFFLFYEGILDERPSDRVAITYFDSDLLPASTCCAALTPVATGIGTTIVNELNSLNASDPPSGSTGMGNGFKNAAGKLSTTTNARTIFVFTDGRQNVPLPSVNTNGLGFSDGSAWIAGGSPGDMKIFAIGIDSPNGNYRTTLEGLANNNRGSLNFTSNGAAFNFITGNTDGDLSSGFTNAFVDALAEFSPQLVARSDHNLLQGQTATLESFPLNNRVNKLLVQISVDRKMETPELAQLLARIRVAKDGTDVTGQAQTSFVGNYTNTIQLTFTFDTSISGSGDLTSGGDWTVALLDVSNLRQSYARVTVIAEDHRLDFTHDLGNSAPLVNEPLNPKVTLAWRGTPITDANVRAVLGIPGTDLGALLSEGQNVDPQSGVDAPLPGTQKYNNLFANDPAFRDALARASNVLQLNHTGNGEYTATFNGNDKAGIGQVIYLISGSHPEAGDYQRFATESFNTNFADVDLPASNVVVQSATANSLIFLITPVTSYGVKIGPAMSTSFAVSNPAVTLDVEDLQNGTYRVSATGPVSSPMDLTILDKDVYSGPLDQISSEKSFLDRICDFLTALGLPCSVFWIILLIILLAVAYIIRRRSQNP